MSPCQLIDGAIVCTARTTDKRKTRRWCPTCQARTTFYSFFADWYGWDTTCIRCGESWQDGERRPRPFERGWRQRSIEAARRRWARPVMPSLLYEEHEPPAETKAQGKS